MALLHLASLFALRTMPFISSFNLLCKRRFVSPHSSLLHFSISFPLHFTPRPSISEPGPDLLLLLFGISNTELVIHLSFSNYMYLNPPRNEKAISLRPRLELLRSTLHSTSIRVGPPHLPSLLISSNKGSTAFPNVSLLSTQPTPKPSPLELDTKTRGGAVQSGAVQSGEHVCFGLDFDPRGSVVANLRAKKQSGISNSQSYSHTVRANSFGLPVSSSFQ